MLTAHEGAAVRALFRLWQRGRSRSTHPFSGLWFTYCVKTIADKFEMAEESIVACALEFEMSGQAKESMARKARDENTNTSTFFGDEDNG